MDRRRYCALVQIGTRRRSPNAPGLSQGPPDGPLGLGVSIMFICSDALSVYREATARGLKPSLPFVGNGMWVTSLRDPDGYSVEFESETNAPEGSRYDDNVADGTA